MDRGFEGLVHKLNPFRWICKVGLQGGLKMCVPEAGCPRDGLYERWIVQEDVANQS